MSDKTGIEWTDATWSPVSGCTRVSPGCQNCYIERTPPFRMAHRRFDSDQIGATTGVQLHHERMLVPMHWRKPRKVFVCSMADLFHDDVPDSFIGSVFDVMAKCSQHTFQVLTKRPARMRALLTKWATQVPDDLPQYKAAFRAHQGVWAMVKQWPLPNVWLGVSTENQQWADIRIPALLDTPAAVRFISAEPLLGRINLRREWGHGPGIDWIIVGGESGPGARPMHPGWARALRDQRSVVGAAFLFKQWGEWGPAPWKLQREPDEFTLDYKARAEATCATHAFTGGMYNNMRGDVVEHFMKLDHVPWSAERDDQAPPCAEGMRRWGKKAAGRELDGRTWDEYPASAAAVSA